MTHTTLLIGQEDVDALIDRELDPDRHIGLLAVLRQKPGLTDQVVDRAAMMDILADMRSDLYQDDPKLRELISILMNRVKG